MDGDPRTIEQCVTQRGVLAQLASGLRSEDLRRNPGRSLTDITALRNALSMAPPAVRQRKLALDGDRLVLAPHARAPRHGGRLACPGELIAQFDVDTIHVSKGQRMQGCESRLFQQALARHR